MFEFLIYSDFYFTSKLLKYQIPPSLFNSEGNENSLFDRMFYIGFFGIFILGAYLSYWSWNLIGYKNSSSIHTDGSFKKHNKYIQYLLIGCFIFMMLAVNFGGSIFNLKEGFFFLLIASYSIYKGYSRLSS